MYNKEEQATFSAMTPMLGGHEMFGVDKVNRPTDLLHLVEQDHGMDPHKKTTLLALLRQPGLIERLLMGAAGAVIARMLASYTGMSKPARSLLSLAGFGIGNILYDNLHKKNFVEHDSETGESRIKL